RTEANWDGMKIEYSLNNGSTWNDLGSVANSNWYNDTDVNAFNNDEDGWSGDSGGWLNRSINLTAENPNFDTSTQVRFRVLFASDGSYTDRGVAFDEILIEGDLATPQPEINLVGNSTNIPDGDITPSLADDTDFGSISSGSTLDHTFTIENIGTATLNLTGGTPLVDISGDAAFTILTQPSGNTIATSSSRTFVVRFAPTGNGTVSADISIDNNDSNENPYTFRVQGTGVAPLTEGPGGVTNDLALWLKGTDGLSYTSGDPVTLWADQGRGSNATLHATGQEPTYYDTPSQNVNFNPVVNFDNIATEADGDFTFTATPQQFLTGTSGYYTNDIFAVVIPNQTVNSSFGSMDIFCSDHDTGTTENDGSGIGFGAYSQRFSGEVLCYAYAISNGLDNGYGVSQNGTSYTYDNVGIINARHNDAVTAQELYYNAINKVNNTSDAGAFGTIADGKFWSGRSEGSRGS